MSSPEDNNDQPQPTKPDSQKPYQRPGKLGEDYDEYGEEMAPNARVWKKYVEDTDKSDKELVDGWNGLLDIILLFAALFSAISTAFVIESYKDLKPDPAETSSQTLILISQILLATSTGSPANLSNSINTEPPAFSPPCSAVMVNALWFASLSLSVAVSLVAILAKEWCRSFMSGRVGSSLRQARLRQQRWDGVGRWGMKWVLSVLPLLMHAALLLFAIGLSVFLWNIHVQVALPVIVISGIATLFYLVTGILPFFFRFCPYRTAITTSLYPYWVSTIEIIFKAPSRIWYHLRWFLMSFDLHFYPSRHLDAIASYATRWGQCMRDTLSTDRSALIEQETPMDNVTSSMLSWMIANCEESKSVDLALQALAGAEPRLPREPLWECGTIELVARRLRFYLDSIDKSHSTGSQGLGRDSLLDYASLYTRSLNFLVESIQGKVCGRVVYLSYSESERSEHIWRDEGDQLYPTLGCVRSNSLLSHSCSEQTPRYEIAALELNNMFFGILHSDGLKLAEGRQQFDRQKELLERITTSKLTTLPLASMVALVNAFTKSYLYNPQQPLCLLVDLLNMASSATDKPTLRQAIGVALTVAAFVNHDFPGTDTPTINDETRLLRAQKVYSQLQVQIEDRDNTTASLLIFGLLGLLMKPFKMVNHSQSGIKSICRALDIVLDTGEDLPYINTILTLPSEFDLSQHFHHVVSNQLSPSSEDSDTLGLSTPFSGFADPVQRPSLCKELGTTELIILLIKAFTSTTSQPDELTRICLLGCIHGAAGGKVLNQRIVRKLRTRHDSRSYHQHYNGPRMPWDDDGMELAERWIHDLTDICNTDPQGVLGSGILHEMIQFYQEDSEERVIPPAVKLPSQFSRPSTWLAVLQKLEDDCKAAVEGQRDTEGLEEAGEAHEGEGVHEPNNDGADHDWSC